MNYVHVKWNVYGSCRSQNVIDQQKQLIAKLRSAATKSLPNDASFTYSQPTHRSGCSSGN